MTMKNVYRLFPALFLMTYIMSMSVFAAENGQSEVDIEKPTLIASINNGVIYIQGEDAGSGVASIYVNNQEISDLKEEALTIQLQQFDSGYEYFSLQAKDQAGNISDLYKLANPYYINESLTGEEKEQALAMKESLPFSGIPTSPTDAQGTITEYTQVTATQTAKEFYTIQTQSDKVFYLIIDKSKEENNVYLLTEVSENDLLNFAENNSEVLPQNSLIMDAAVPGNSTMPLTDAASSYKTTMQSNEKEETITEEVDNQEETIENGNVKKLNNLGSYIMIGVVVLVVGGIGVYQKLIKGKKDHYDMDEDEDQENEEEYENEDENQ